MGHKHNSFTRRALAPVAVTVLVLAGPLAAPASATPRAAGEVVQLPNGFSPEGIAIDQRTATAYAGSLADGSIERIDLTTGRVSRLSPSPGPHRLASGGDIDGFGRLWVAGGGGIVPGVVSGFRVYDTKTGVLLTEVTVPGAGYLNDVTVTRDAAWFTDSLSPVLIRVPIGPGGRIGAPEKVRLGGDWVEGSAGFNANGIDTTPDGAHLIVGQSQAVDGHSAFYLVPTSPAAVAAARRIALNGTVDGADGLQLNGRTLSVANPHGVVEIELSRSLTEGRVLGATAVPGAAWPSAVKAFGCRLYVVDANFGVDNSNVGNPAATFKLVAIPRP
jgi:sugar lactone lactonase YvrE